MRLTDKAIDEITQLVAAQFPGFGGGKAQVPGNPISEALKEKPHAFALGVPVRDVVLATLKAYAKRKKGKEKA